jgi:peptidoglycan/LPS O-acetylase OafA/YrhL
VFLAVIAVLCVSLGMSSVSAKLTTGFSYTLKAVCIALLVWMAVRSRNTWTTRFLNQRIVAAIGVLSYSLYLWQQIFLHPGQTAFACVWPQNVIFAILAALLSYLVIERPFLLLKSRFSASNGSQGS